MDEVLLGKGNFARVELATHQITEIKVSIFIRENVKNVSVYIQSTA